MGTISCYLQRGYRGQSLLGKGVYLLIYLFLGGGKVFKGGGGSWEKELLNPYNSQ